MLTARVWMFVLVFAATTVVAVPAVAQDSENAEAAALARGWSALAGGDAASASAIANGVLGQNPGSAAALVLAVDAEVARAGAVAGLNVYESWLRGRPLDDAYVLRRVARALLVEVARGAEASQPKLEALKALTADGDPAAAAIVQAGVASGATPEARMMAALGDERAVRALLAQLETTPGGKGAIIASLGESRSPLALPALIHLLTDQLDINRMAAADALGQLGRTEAVAHLKPLLNDPVFTVKLAAARALHRLDDYSGVPFLQELARSEHAAVRIGALESFAEKPDPWWQGIARDLATDPDPAVRLDVARLMAPYDQALATRILQGLLSDQNPALREGAARVLAEDVASDFAALRGLLRSGDPGVRVQSAGRILQLTR